MKSIILIILVLTKYFPLDAQINDSINNSYKDLRLYGDSIFKLKGYRLILSRFDSQREDETKNNAVFIFSKLSKGKYIDILKDSLFVFDQEIKLENFNCDNITDILIQNYSDARSNLTYYLYLVDTTYDNLIKIKGFEEIKNPHYLSDYNLIDNYVTSGTNWTGFYKIQGDKVVDLGIEIEDDLTGNNKYQLEYSEAIEKILKNKKNNR